MSHSLDAKNKLITDLISAIQKVNKSNDKNEADLKDLHAQVVANNKYKDMLNEKMSEDEEQKSVNLDAMSQKVNSMLNDNTTVKNMKTDLETTTDSKVDELQKKIIDLEKKIEDMLETKGEKDRRMLEQIKRLQAAIDDDITIPASSEMQGLQQTIIDLQNNVQELNRQLDEYKKKNTSLAAELANATTELQKLRTGNETLDAIKEENRILKIANTELEATYEADIEIAAEEFDKLDNQITDLAESTSKRIKQLTDDNKSITEVSEELSIDFDELTAEKKKLEGTLERLLQTLETLRQNNKETKNNPINDITTLVDDDTTTLADDITFVDDDGKYAADELKNELKEQDDDFLAKIEKEREVSANTEFLDMLGPGMSPNNSFPDFSTLVGDVEEADLDKIKKYDPADAIIKELEENDDSTRFGGSPLAIGGMCALFASKHITKIMLVMTVLLIIYLIYVLFCPHANHKPHPNTYYNLPQLPNVY
jgi:DNA repair exonuclease SbcCD ATPase subunit